MTRYVAFEVDDNDNDHAVLLRPGVRAIMAAKTTCRQIAKHEDREEVRKDANAVIEALTRIAVAVGTDASE